MFWGERNHLEPTEDFLTVHEIVLAKIEIDFDVAQPEDREGTGVGQTGIPWNPISIGRVMTRSICSEGQPEYCVMTSIIGVEGSGYTSISSM